MFTVRIFGVTAPDVCIRLAVPFLIFHIYENAFSSDVNEAVITEAGGHKDLSVTMNYIHIPLAEKLAAVNKIYKIYYTSIVTKSA